MLLLLTWLVVFALLGIPVAAAHAWWRGRGEPDARILVAGPLVFVGALGYIAFFAFFLHPFTGELVAWVAPCALGIYWARTWRAAAKVSLPFAWPALLTFAIGLFYLALLYLPQLGRAPEWQSQIRFLYEFPIDANLPKVFGDRLYAGESPRPFLGDWLSSDRPPLQVGLYLLVLPWLELLRLPAGLGYQCAGTLAQLIWVPAVWLVLQRLGMTRRRALIVILLTAASGFSLFNTTYVWPKLLAAGFVLLAGILLLDRSAPRTPAVMRLAAAAAALGWLAHGAAAFSLLPLGLILLWPRFFPGWRNTLQAAAVFALFAAPWLAYQRCYDPPANRLMKWHLAGVVPIDHRSTPTALRDAYALPWRTTAGLKWDNTRVLFFGSFASTLDLFTTPVRQRRVDEFFYLFRSLGLLNLAWLLAPIAWLVRRRRPAGAGLQAALFAWTILTLAGWCLLMYGPGTTILHQGSYAMVLGFFLLAIVWLMDLPRWLALPVLGWHVAGFGLTWLPYFGSAPLDPAMVGLMALAILLGVVAVRDRNSISLPPAMMDRCARLARRSREAWRVSWKVTPGRYPWRVALATAGLAGLILFLRRPEVFLHPQFWAEDGGIFFLQAEFLGRSAFFHAYGGYQHLLLRLVAAAASGLDPLWIPAIYFWASIAVIMALVLALFSPRLDVPRRPWLALAVVLLPHTGEVFQNLTNVQWLSALALMLLLWTRDAERLSHWLIDLVVAALVGLTGVFSLLFLPLFLLRALIRRTVAAWALGVVVLAAAGTQAATLLANPSPAPSGGGNPVVFLRVVGERIWASLLLPRNAAGSLSAPGFVVLALAATLLLAYASWRQPRQRLERLMLWGGFGAVVTATLYKFRGQDFLLFGANADRYFFLPKILMLWLVIFEWDGPHRQWARLAGLLTLVATLSAFRFEPFVDYHWPEWAARIRAGESVVVPLNPVGTTFVYPGHPRR